MNHLPGASRTSRNTGASAGVMRHAAVAAAGLAAFLAVVAPVEAAQPTVEWGRAGTAQPFKDLPGVRAQDQMSFDEGYTCKTVTVAPRLNQRRTLEDTMPRIMYRCEKDGIVYQGSSPPTSGWYPGVNPRIID